MEGRRKGEGRQQATRREREERGRVGGCHHSLIPSPGS